MSPCQPIVWWSMLAYAGRPAGHPSGRSTQREPEMDGATASGAEGLTSTTADQAVSLSLVLASQLIVPSVGQAAENAGLHRVWTTEFLGRDAVIRAVSLGQSTTRLQVGTGIAYAFTRVPRALAATALDAAEITGGRFTLGLGAGTRGLRRSFGVEFEPPATRVGELVTQLRATWAEPAWERAVPPPQIALAGVNEAMLRTAAHYGDRVVLHPLCLVEAHLHERVLPSIHTGRSRRDSSDVAVSAWCIASVDGDAETARERARRQLAFYLSTPGYRGVVEGTPFQVSAQQLREEFVDSTPADWTALSRHVPDDLLDQVSVSGTADDVRSGVSRLRQQLSDIGIDELVLQIVYADDGDAATTIDALLAAVAPLQLTEGAGVSVTPRKLRPAPAWAHANGLVALHPRSGADLDLRGQLVDRLARYCWGFDERRRDILQDCFTQDAVWVGDVMGETRVGPFEGRDAVVSWLAGFWPHQRDQRRHVVTNVIVEDVGDGSATCLAYLLLVGSSRRSVALEAAGMYRIEYRLDAGAWRISRLSAGFDIPFWKGEVQDMEPWVSDLFGIDVPKGET